MLPAVLPLLWLLAHALPAPSLTVPCLQLFLCPGCAVNHSDGLGMEQFQRGPSQPL